MQGGTVRAAAAGFLAVVMLSALGPSMAAAVEAAEDQPAPAARLQPIEPASEPGPRSVPPQAPPPHPTQKPKPAPTPKPKPKPKPPKPTPPRQTPGERPDGQAPGDPNPVRPAEPPAAPVAPEPGAGEPGGAPALPPGGGAGSTPTGQGAPVIGPPPSRVQLVVAGATVSGIAAVAGWLVLGGRRRERLPGRPPVRVPRPPFTTVTLADGMQLDLEVVVNRPDGAPQPRYSGRVPGTAATTLWTDEDDRPRWIRRFDEQGPARRRAPRSSVGVEDRDED